MQVLFRVDDAGELVMIELQGMLESTTGEFKEQELGRFQVSGKDATLVIGNHEMQGKAVALAKPLVATKKGADGTLVVMGCVRQKYVFKTRPNHVMTSGV